MSNDQQDSDASDSIELRDPPSQHTRIAATGRFHVLSLSGDNSAVQMISGRTDESVTEVVCSLPTEQDRPSVSGCNNFHRGALGAFVTVKCFNGISVSHAGLNVLILVVQFTDQVTVEFFFGAIRQGFPVDVVAQNV